MKTTFGTAAAATLALHAPAVAQEGSWQFELVGGVGTEANPLRPGQESATVRLSIGVPADDWGLALVRWFTHADEEGWSNPIALLTHPGQMAGELRGPTVGPCAVGQLSTCTGFMADPGRLVVWQSTFSVVNFDRREIELWTETNRYDVFPRDPCPSGPEAEAREVIEGSATIFVVPALCYADCDGSGSLDFFDFLCFQNAFAAGDMYADCDGSGGIDLLDFLCFQDGFVAGCS